MKYHPVRSYTNKSPLTEMLESGELKPCKVRTGHPAFCYKFQRPKIIHKFYIVVGRLENDDWILMNVNTNNMFTVDKDKINENRKLLL